MRRAAYYARRGYRYHSSRRIAPRGLNSRLYRIVLLDGAEGAFDPKRLLDGIRIGRKGTNTRCYRTLDRAEISVDGELLTAIPSMTILRALQAQVSPVRSNVLYRTFASNVPNANSFRSALWNIRQIFRSKGISKGDEDQIIKST